MSTQREGSTTPPPAPDVTADPRAPKQDPPTPPPSIAPNGPEMINSKVNHITEGSRNNEVRSVILYGIPIVSLIIDGQERLCLAQISNTLLKHFSYNEIHNRRVALGITCVQCTPVQLELLRRAGAMPVSSRRCGMISKREAERLCKSFLAETAPPKLPDNFAFDIYHQCAWGCRGKFVPSRYNSSRAKCIKCAYCSLFFSPNKFVFHSHRFSDSKYVQPDAANFNSWRRHIKLIGTPSDDVIHAWEDVKAMFNGGSRKRVTACSSLASSSRNQEAKRPRFPGPPPPEKHSSSLNPPNDGSKSPYLPVVPFSNKNYHIPPAPPFVAPTSPFYYTAGKPFSASDIRQCFAEYMWAGKQSFPLPYGPMFWSRDSNPSSMDYREDAVFENMVPPSLALNTQAPLLSSTSDIDFRKQQFEVEPTQTQVKSPDNTYPRTSAFRPVSKTGNRPFQVEPPVCDTTADTTTTCGETSDTYRSGSRGSASLDVDVTDMSSNDGVSESSLDHHGNPGAHVIFRPMDEVTPSIADTSVTSIIEGKKQCSTTTSSFDVDVPTQDSSYKETDEKEHNPQVSASLTSQESFPEALLQETEARRRVQKEYDRMRETFQEQVRKEMTYREELAKQLQLVRDALCQELEQERKARFTVQQKLKEAHTALQTFTCKMLNPRHCAECGYKPSLTE
ncbi:SKI family transcriptional corepressor 1 homolog-B-like isoform X1 [Limulus polyphemus]|uniref:SKI family transcriptional corepressor 1 homolog-B-like isoform X1 n=2 Tax=Limulus polyphemus TaxID=6850 RepID=A0ABM1SRR3_LIMPO|nr:SKI family transcriptional corepressor 1 homolog-B-like isoform X1 [Limulus polyphemus]